MNIRLAGICEDSIVDGHGIRYTIFVQGCPHHCEGCHNPQTHDFNGGYLSTIDEIMQCIEENPLLDGVTFSGGEPFCQAKQLAYLGRKINELNPNLDIITYTGFTFEYLLSHANEDNGYLELLKVSNMLVDGKFEKDKQSYDLVFRGSSNQRFIDCQRSLKSKKAINFKLVNA
ncbi:MAG: anaerobic ribonucleoside-triphosphate reductase activating protein [Oscillospiraceae bacterium]